MSIDEFIKKYCRGNNGIKCGQDDGCIFVDECRQDHDGDSCEEFVIRQLKGMLEGREADEPNAKRD